MNVRVLARFLFGDARAIREVAENRSALWYAIALVLLTGVARNYDQNYYLETPMSLLGPVLFSFISGSFLYWILVARFARRHFPEDLRRVKQWRCFMALFWMTSPIAWLYAIPVERFMEPLGAARANLGLLAVVSLWRVLLMSRILSVLFEVRYLRMLGWVLLAASLETVIVLLGGAFSSGALSRSIMAAMMGMRHAPEESLISNALGYVWVGSLGVLVVCMIAVSIEPLRAVLTPLPKPMPGRSSPLSIIMFAVVWTFIAIPAQLEQHRYVTHATLVGQGKYVEAVGYLAKYQRRDFPASRRLQPNPYEFDVWEHLPPTIGALASNTPAWIRQVYLSHLAVTLSHRYTGYDSWTNLVTMLSAMERLPEGAEWLRTNQVSFSQKVFAAGNWRQSIPTDDPVARTNVALILRRMGMAETNLARLLSPEGQSQ